MTSLIAIGAGIAALTGIFVLADKSVGWAANAAL